MIERTDEQVEEFVQLCEDEFPENLKKLSMQYGMGIDANNV